MACGFCCTVTIYPSPMTGILAPELRVKLLLPSTVVVAAAGAAAAVVVVAADAMMRVVLVSSLWLLCSCGTCGLLNKVVLSNPKRYVGNAKSNQSFLLARILIHLLA